MQQYDLLILKKLLGIFSLYNLRSSINVDRSKTPSVKTDSLATRDLSINNTSSVYKNLNKKSSKTNITPKSMKMPVSPNLTKHNLNQSYHKNLQKPSCVSNENYIKAKSIIKERSSEKSVKTNKIISYCENNNFSSVSASASASVPVSGDKKEEKTKFSNLKNNAEQLKQIKLNLVENQLNNCERKLSILDVDAFGPLIDVKHAEAKNLLEDTKDKIQIPKDKKPIDKLTNKLDKVFYILAKSK